MNTEGITSTNTLATLSTLNSPINNSEKFNELFLYVKKNTVIFGFLNSIDLDEKKKHQTQILLSAINRGDFKAEIFNDSYCHLYLLYLIKNNQILFNHAMTVYLYLIALMQCTTKQNLKESDQDYKNLRKVKVILLSENNELTENGAEFLKQLAASLKKSTNESYYNELAKFVSTLPPTEQWLTIIKNDTSDKQLSNPLAVNYRFNRLFNQLEDFETLPFIQTYSKYHHIPSSSLMQYVLSKASNAPIQLQYAFGRVGILTLNKLHQQGKHPILFYSPCVRSNLLDIHGGADGPIPAVIHDLAHAYWGSLLTPAFRLCIYNELIPNLKLLMEEALHYKNMQSVKEIESLIKRLGDFDLVSTANFTSDTRHYRYFFGPEPVYKHQLKSNGKLGQCPYDYLIYQMESKQLENPQWSCNFKFYWETIIERIQNRNFMYRSDNENLHYMDILRKLAHNNYQHAPLNYKANFDCSINWLAWLELLNSPLNSEDLWNECLKSRYQELLKLLLTYNLIFFHPYLPMTEEKRLQLKQFIEAKLNKPEIESNKTQEVHLVKEGSIQSRAKTKLLVFFKSKFCTDKNVSKSCDSQASNSL